MGMGEVFESADSFCEMPKFRIPAKLSTSASSKICIAISTGSTGLGIEGEDDKEGAEHVEEDDADFALASNAETNDDNSSS